MRLVHSPPARSLSCSAIPTSTTPATTSPRSWSSCRSGSRARRACWSSDMKMQGHPPRATSTLLPDGRGWLLVEFGGDDQGRGRRPGATADGRAEEASRAAGMKLFDDARKRQHRLEGPRVGPRRDRLRPGRAGHVGGLGGLGGPAGAARRLSARPPQAARRSTATTARSTATSGRAASTRGSTSTCRARGGPALPRLHRRGRRPGRVSYGGSLSGEHGDGQSSGRAPAEDVRPGAGRRRSASSRRIWDPDNKMNPGKVVDPYLLDENLRLGPRLRAAAARDALPVPRRQGQLRRRHRALRRRGRVPQATERRRRCARARSCRQEEMHSTRGRAHLLFEMLQGDPMKGGLAETSRSRRRSTSACRARAARANAR